eukprot:jgi/Psemu1/20003/gm1.20003_g
MGIPNNNVGSDADSNISQILLCDDDRKPSSAWKDPPLGDISAKKKTPNLEIALFSHQKNNADFSSSSSSSTSDNDNDNDSIENPPNDKNAPLTNKAPNKKAPPNPRHKVMKALLMKKSPYTRAIKTTFLVNFKGLSLSDLHQNKHSSALIKLQTKAINFGSNLSQRQQNWNIKFMVPILVSIHSRYKVYKKEDLVAAFCTTLRPSSRNNHSISASSFQTQTIKYLDQIEKDFDGTTNQYIEQMEAVAAKTRQTKQKKAKSVASSKGDRPQDFIEYDITKGDTFPCPKCGHMMPQFESLGQAKKSQVQGAAVGKAVAVRSVTANPKELEEATAPKTMPGLLVSMIHDSIAEATCDKFLEDTTANQQFQKAVKEAMGPIKKTPSMARTLTSLEPSIRGRWQYHQMTLGLINTRARSFFQPITIDGETNDSNQQPRTLMGTPLAMAPAKEIEQMPQYVRDVKMEAFDRSCKENTTQETCNVLDLMAENLTNQEDSKVARVLKKRVELSCQRGNDVEACCNDVVQWGKHKMIADKERDK